jgi:glycosyltransferase involved in cell wall biosynthesis
MPRFVIVTPVLNGERFISDTLLCIDRQNWADWIHIVVDGGSTDGTAAIVEQSALREPRRKLVTGKDRGLYDAVFKGFDAVEAREDDILSWLNADDMLAPWALATVAAAFVDGSEWVTAMPGQWDEDGRLVQVIPSAWYPQALLRLGLFHGRGLGYLQQESTFFSRTLLGHVNPEIIGRIRTMRYAGDFALWRELSQHAQLRSLATVIGGFRLHGSNVSAAQERYFAEAAMAGARFPPPPLARAMRALYRLIALLVTAARARKIGLARERQIRPPR